MLTGLLLAGLLVAQPADPTATVSLKAPSSKKAGKLTYLVKAGVGVVGSVKVTIPDGLHGYQNPPADPFEIPVRIESAQPEFKLSKVTYPKGIDFQMEGAEKPTKVYEGTIEIPFTLTVSKLKPGQSGSFDLKVHYQLCSSNNCWPPKALEISTQVQVRK